MLKNNSIKISIDGKGQWVDNVFIERLWRSLKYECVYLNAFRNFKDAQHQLGVWFNYYHDERRIPSYTTSPRVKSMPEFGH